jgi:hypothetical protein
MRLTSALVDLALAEDYFSVAEPVDFALVEDHS